jgi:hypothetical protein
VEALRRTAAADPTAHLAALRSFQTSLVMAGPAPFPARELDAIRGFATARQYDLLWLPDLGETGTSIPEASEEELRALGVNRYNVVPGAPHFRTFSGLVAASDPDSFYRVYDYAIAPPTDNRPFFFHFFKWRQTPQIIAVLGKTWQPFGGTGYLVLVLLLALVVLLSLVLILLPLAVGRVVGKVAAEDRTDGKTRFNLRYLLYFSLLGLGFLFVEIPLLQRFIVYLGQPAYAFAVVVGALLVASGLGSRYLANRIRPRQGIAALVVLVFTYPMLLPTLFEVTFGLPLAGRIGVAALGLAPLGLLMGTPFPQGLAIAQQHAPGLTPWIWAVNGCASVISAVLAPMVAIDLGFGAVMLIGAGAYLGALISLGRAAGRATPVRG